MLSIGSIAPTVFAPMRTALTNVKMQEAAAVEPEFNPIEFAKTLPGITDPLGFFDPLGFCSQDGVTEGKIRV